jgi:hypothetical protein
MLIYYKKKVSPIACVAESFLVMRIGVHMRHSASLVVLVLFSQIVSIIIFWAQKNGFSSYVVLSDSPPEHPGSRPAVKCPMRIPA